MFSSRYPVEAILRPIHEYYPAFVHFMCALIFILIPEHLMLTAQTGYLFAAISLLRATQRVIQGREVADYQAGLWRYQKHSIHRINLPVSTNRLYLGHGFKWTPKHTQRMADIDEQNYYAQVPDWYRSAQSLKIKHEDSPFVSALLKPLDSDWRLNPFRPSEPPNNSGTVALHAIGRPEGYKPVYLADAQRTGHTAIFGTTGVGKSVLMAMMARQDIAAGHVTIVLDPKGDPALLAACYDEAVRAGRQDEFHCFHLGFPEFSSAYSPIGTFSRITEVASRISSLLPGDGQSLAFREFVWRFVNCVAQTMTALGNKLDIKDIGKYGLDINPLAEEYLEHYLATTNHRGGSWRTDINEEDSKGKIKKLRLLCNYFNRHRIDDDLAMSLIYYVEYDRSHLEKLIGSLLPLINKLTTGQAAQLLSPDYADGSRSIFSWPEIIRSGGIVYVGLDSLTDSEVSSAVGNSMFSDLTSTLGDIYKHSKPEDARKICIYADEFAELVGPTFTQILNKGRGAGVRVTVGAQTVEDLAVGFGDKDRAGQALGNFNNLLSLRSKNLATAELLTEQLKPTRIHSMTVISSARDSADTDSPQKFVSSNEQRITTERVEQLDAATMASLPPGEGFAYIDGGTLFKIKIPLIADEVTNAASDVGSVIARMNGSATSQLVRRPSNKVSVSVKAPEGERYIPAMTVRANIGSPSNQSTS